MVRAVVMPPSPARWWAALPRARSHREARGLDRAPACCVSPPSEPRARRPLRGDRAPARPSRWTPRRVRWYGSSLCNSPLQLLKRGEQGEMKLLGGERERLAARVSWAVGLHCDGPLLARPSAAAGTPICLFGGRRCLLGVLGGRLFFAACYGCALCWEGS